MRILGLLLCAGLFAVPSAAKLKVFIGVDFSADERLEAEIKGGIAARFNSTERYTTTESVTGTDIFLHVMCVPVKLQNANHNVAIACTANSFYYPFKGGLSHHLAEASFLATDSPENLHIMIGDFADKVINETTDEKLTNYKKAMMTSIQSTCLTEPAICRLPLQ